MAKKLSVLTAFLSSAYLFASGETSCLAPDWDFSVGPSYVIPFAYHTRGDISQASMAPGTNMPVSGHDLSYENGWGFNLSLGRNIRHDLNLSLNYETFKTEISTKDAIVEASNGSLNSYNANLTLNTFLLKARYIMPGNFHFFQYTRFYLGVSAGTSNLFNSQQRLVELGGVGGPFAYTLKNHSAWRFAYSAEVGGSTTFFLERLKLEYGVRFTSYGRYSSGTDVIEGSSLRSSVGANLCAIAPYISLVVGF